MFQTKRKINFYDCDPAGILFFARIYELCHSAYEDLIASFNLKEDYWNNDEYVAPILNSEAHYHQPIKYGETLSIRINVTQLKSSSFELEYHCLNSKGEECTAVRTVHIFVDKASWKKCEMKREIREGLAKHKI